MPIVSIILPTQNRASLLKRAIESVQKQTFKDWELIIIDDASGDDTPVLVDKIKKYDSRIRFIRNEKPLGGAGARNVGIKLSLGNLVAFLDDDDFWFPHKLEQQLIILGQNPKTIACACSFIISKPSGCKRVVTPPREVSLKEVLLENFLGGASMCLCQAKELKNIKGFDESLQSGQDWDLWIRLRKTGKIIGSSKVLAHYESHAGSRITSDQQKRYSGLRHIYFKYRNLMGKNIRKIRILELYYLRSKNSYTMFLYRIYLFRFLIFNGSFGITMAKTFMVLPRIIQATVISLFEKNKEVKIINN